MKRVVVLGVLATLTVLEISCNKCRVSHAKYTIESIELNKSGSKDLLDSLTWSNGDIQFDMKINVTYLAFQNNNIFVNQALACEESRVEILGGEARDIIKIIPELGFDSSFALNNDINDFFEHSPFGAVPSWHRFDSFFFEHRLTSFPVNNIRFRARKRPNSLPAKFHFIRKRKNDIIWKSRTITVVE